MDNSLIMVSSITYAIKGKDLLNKSGFKADIVRTPRRHNVTGCGYSIFVKDRTDEAESYLKEYGIPILGRTSRDDAV